MQRLAPPIRQNILDVLMLHPAAHLTDTAKAEPGLELSTAGIAHPDLFQVSLWAALSVRLLLSSGVSSVVQEHCQLCGRHLREEESCPYESCPDPEHAQDT